MNFSVEIPDDQLAKIDEIARKYELKDRKDVFNLAISLLGWATDKRAEGCQIGALDCAGPWGSPRFTPLDLDGIS